MFLVDGNNVMGQRAGWHLDKQAARRGLLDELAQFAAQAGKRVQVVFDGAAERFFPDGSSYQGVRVFYACAGSNADERIKRIVESSRERRTLWVVTSDRALADYVRRCGASVVAAGEFRRRMEEVCGGGSHANAEERAGGAVRAEEVDVWMRYFGVDATDDER